MLSAGSAHVAAGLFESADPGGVRVGLYETRVSKMVVLDSVWGRGRGAGGVAKELQEMVVF